MVWPGDARMSPSRLVRNAGRPTIFAAERVERQAELLENAGPRSSRFSAPDDGPLDPNSMRIQSVDAEGGAPPSGRR